MQKDRCIWQMYFFCKTEWRKFQTIAIKHSFHPPELNRGVCWNPGNTESWKIALKHANSWKQRRHEMLLKLSSDPALKQKAIILSKLINDHSFIHCTGVVRELFSLHNPVRVQVCSTGHGHHLPQSQSHICLGFLSQIMWSWLRL